MRGWGQSLLRELWALPNPLKPPHGLLLSLVGIQSQPLLGEQSWKWCQKQTRGECEEAWKVGNGGRGQLPQSPQGTTWAPESERRGTRTKGTGFRGPEKRRLAGVQTPGSDGRGWEYSGLPRPAEERGSSTLFCTDFRSLTLTGGLENRVCNVKVRAGDLDSWDPREGGGWGPAA